MRVFFFSFFVLNLIFNIGAFFTPFYGIIDVSGMAEFFHHDSLYVEVTGAYRDAYEPI